MASSNNENYFCHICNSMVPICQDGNCVTCNDGFIERVESNNSLERDYEGSIFHTIPQNHSENRSPENSRSFFNTSEDLDNQNNVLGQLISNLFGGVDFSLDPTDYMFSDRIFNNIVARIMDQNEQFGPSPASSEVIENLPKFKVNEPKDTCSICLSDYQMDDEVSELPCMHQYHFNCVKSWLVKCGTCPICRKNYSQR